MKSRRTTQFAVGTIAVIGTIAATTAVAAPAHAQGTHQGRSAASQVAAHQPTLSYGAHGSAVRLAQQDLTRDGYRVVADGIFGSKTRAAVLAFQSAQSVAADGVIGQITWGRLSHPLPTLGLSRWGGQPTRGFGHVRPTVIDNGGDATGLVTRVSWSSWGGRTANGTGTGTYVPPKKPVAGGIPVRASIRASDLTSCGGHSAYRHLTWWFPSKGETYQWAIKNHVESYNVCHAS